MADSAGPEMADSTGTSVGGFVGRPDQLMTGLDASVSSSGQGKGGGKHVLVLGGGLAGLSAGCRLGRNGWRVTVVEAGDEVGGLASSGTRFTQWGEFDYDTG